MLAHIILLKRTMSTGFCFFFCVYSRRTLCRACVLLMRNAVLVCYTAPHKQRGMLINSGAVVLARLEHVCTRQVGNPTRQLVAGTFRVNMPFWSGHAFADSFHEELSALSREGP